MFTAQRQRGRRRAAAVATTLAIAVGLVGGLAGIAGAASEAEFVGPAEGKSASIEGTVDGDRKTYDAGLFDIVIDGEVDANAYCIDIHTGISGGTHLDEIEWDEANVANLAKVEAILRWYYPNGDGPEGHLIEGSDAQKAAATQAAIWHYTDGFELDVDGDDNDATIVSNYLTILEAVEGGLDGFGEPEVTLSITPPSSTEGPAGGLVGPYVVNTSAATATVTASEGVTLHNEDGSPFTGDVVDGTELWLSSDAAGSGTITATASAEAQAGRVFFKAGSQKLVLATTVRTDASAEAPVSFTTPPTTPSTTSSTTTVPEETTTTPSTPETTTVTEAPTTTPTTQPESGGGLPVTGAQSILLAAVALVLLAVGAGFGIISRRKRMEG